MLAPSTREDYVGRAGRKRKGEGARYKSGRLKPKKKDVDECVRLARAQPHRRELKSNDRSSELAESALGRLNLAGKVTNLERAAGEMFGRVVGRYRRVIEGPRAVRSLWPLTLDQSPPAEEEEGGARFACASEHADPIERQVAIGGQLVMVREWPCGQLDEGCQCAQRGQRYQRAYEAIARVGRRALMAVIAVAVRGEDLPAEEIVYLKAGLDAAQEHFGLADRRRGS